LFGERGSATDFYYAEDLKGFAADGTLARTDLVYSRDGENRRYVQHLVAEASVDIAAWVGRGASILVCGGLEMAAGVQDALIAILGEEKLDQMTQSGLYRRDIY
jgi:sulfite reductase (NADPH) flavoprotein alpha-component